MYRRNKTITLTAEQEKFVRDNFKKLTQEKIASAIGLNVSTLKNNLYVMGLSKTKGQPKSIAKNGFFSWEEFANADMIFRPELLFRSSKKQTW